jgi:predicted secreted protein
MKTDPESNNPIEVIIGQVFTISLEAIPPAGYRWNVEYESKMIDFLKPKTYVPYSSKTVGGGGREIFEFKAKQAGETLIKAKYQRREQTPLETKLFKVHIRQ